LENIEKNRKKNRGQGELLWDDVGGKSSVRGGGWKEKRDEEKGGERLS
jgi:hypothetical protein